MTSEDIGWLSKKCICFGCVEEDFLSNEIKRDGTRAKCSYCGRSRRSYSIRELADRIEAAFGDHYYRTSDQPPGWNDWERDGERVVDAIMNAALIPEAAASDAQRVLDDRHYDLDAARMGDEMDFADTSYYAEKRPDDKAWHEEWLRFENSLKTEARFFSQTASDHLAAVFEGMERMAASDARPVVVLAGPGTTREAIYRARVFQSEDELLQALSRPDLHVGPPPPQLATAGRMNPRGISVFYGASDPRVAIAETRPPVGSWVVVARFDFLRELKLLDLEALNGLTSTGSIFDSAFARRRERESFLRSLSFRLSKPVMPEDEALDYLPTQAIADFLASQLSPALDGIVFPSVQAADEALNIVLFHKASRVKLLEIPDGTEITADTGWMTEDGWEPHYSVCEEVPPIAVKQEVEPVSSLNGRFELPSDWSPSAQDDARAVSLRVSLDFVSVHEVQRVEVRTDEYHVSRDRREKHQPGDLPDF